LVNKNRLISKYSKYRFAAISCDSQHIGDGELKERTQQWAKEQRTHGKYVSGSSVIFFILTTQWSPWKPK